MDPALYPGKCVFRKQWHAELHTMRGGLTSQAMHNIQLIHISYTYMYIYYTRI